MLGVTPTTRPYDRRAPQDAAGGFDAIANKSRVVAAQDEESDDEEEGSATSGASFEQLIGKTF